MQSIKELGDDKNRIIRYLELLAMIGILTEGFLEACSVTFGKTIISVVLWPTVFLSGGLILIRLINWKKYIRSYNLILMIGFCASYALSMAVNLKYGWYRNLRTLIWVAFLMFLLYCYRNDVTSAENQKQIKILFAYYMICNAVMSLASFHLFFTGYAKVFYPETGPIYYLGFHWGRLYGVYWDANIGAVMCCVSIILAVGFIHQSKNILLKILLVLDILLQVSYITFSDSRTGRLCLCSGIFVLFFAYSIKKKKVYQTVLIAAAALCIAFILPSGIKQLYNYAAAQVEEKILEEQRQKEESDPGEVNIPQFEYVLAKAEIGRADEYAGDITNRRMDIWKSAIEIFKTKPITGVGHNNVLAYVKDNLPDSYLVTNDHMQFDSMHNTYLDILVGQGIIGFGLFMLMAVLFLVRIIRHWDALSFNQDPMLFSQFAILAVLVTCSFVMVEMVYVTSPMASIFWISLGGLMLTIDQSLKTNPERKEQ